MASSADGPPPPHDATPAGWGERRNREVVWHDPLPTAAAGDGMTGLDFLQAVAAGRLPPAPIASLLGFRLTRAELGEVVFTVEPNDSHYNPIGMVHGGLVSTLLDSALGCAVHSTLPVGLGYASLEIKVSFVGAVHATSGTLTATGRVVKPGKRAAFAEGEVVDGSGKVVARASSTLLVFPRPA